MKKILRLITVLAGLSASVALADDDDCFVPMADWQPRAAVIQLVADQDWSLQRIKIDDGCYKVYGRDATGRPIEVKLHPETLQVIEFEYEDDDDKNDDDRDKRRKGKSDD